MKDLQNKVAVVTGGASGIGLAIGEALGRAGCRIFLLDMNGATLAEAIDRLAAMNIEVDGAVIDIRDREAVFAAAQKVVARFGKVHIVCNNAGIAALGAIGALSQSDWELTYQVNVFGVVYGIEAFVPLILAHGEGGHIVNTASMGTFLSPPDSEAYSGAKAAVLAMTQGWTVQLRPKGISMSVLFPGLVNTNIADSAKLNYVGGELSDSSQHPLYVGLKQSTVPPGPVGQRVVEAIRDDEFYIFTHISARDHVADRFADIVAAYDRAATSPACLAIARAQAGADQ